MLTKRFHTFLTISLLTVILASCAPVNAAPTADMNAALTQAVGTAFAQLQPTATPKPPDTPMPSPTAPHTPAPLPPVFTTSMLNPLDTPHIYVQDSCQYLKDKWASANSAPGTIAIVVMFHGIIKGQVENPNQITVNDFKRVMNALHDSGFQAINTQQFSDFLHANARIPQQSVLLVQDDRHAAQNFTDHFLPYYQQWGWPVVNGWISAFGGADQYLQENTALSAQGWVDYQAHGVIHNINIGPGSTDEFIMSELQGSIDNIKKYFGKTPIAYIWPGGGFTPHAAQVALQVGYKLGFTINPRGPVMYNWIPLADQIDPAHPDWLPDGAAGAPLMVIPRYWDVDILPHLSEVVQISKDAAAYAEQNKANEMDYYNTTCAPKYGPMQ